MVKEGVLGSYQTASGEDCRQDCIAFLFLKPLHKGVITALSSHC